MKIHYTKFSDDFLTVLLLMQTDFRGQFIAFFNRCQHKGMTLSVVEKEQLKMSTQENDVKCRRYLTPEF
jgi:nitrite reductase/ring-hydroxylating ferredoxin subunit